jgi:hypothetical protein
VHPDNKNERDVGDWNVVQNNGMQGSCSGNYGGLAIPSS